MIGRDTLLRREKHHLARALMAVAFSLWATLDPVPAMAEPPDAGAGQEAPTTQDQASQSLQMNNGFDITRPQTAFEVRGFDEPSSSDTSKTNKAGTLLQLSSKIPLDVDWRVGVLAQVPITQKTTTDFETGSVDREFGFGDAVFQAFIAHDLDERWAIGAGARVSANTAADSIGSGEWQVMPGFGVRYMLYEWGPDSYFVPTMRWALSLTNPGARRISEPQIAPTLNIDLPGPLFLTLYPSHDIRINYGAPVSGQTGPLFLPFDALIGARLSDKAQISFEGSVPIVKEYPVYNFKTEVRLRIVF